ncbi:MAG TPA: hypothetical protein VJ258_06755 [Candidatus Limnocylindrales bacterium]|nr:hypothetical protein [Candidatus Limnocylindrales bacterium]
MQRLRGVMAGALVGVGLAVYVAFWLHGVREVAILVGAGVGLAIGLVVGTRSDAHDAAAEEAWRNAAPDLPPASDRAALERSQAKMPGPDQDRGTSSGSADQDDGAPSASAPSGVAVNEGAEPQ